jgi:hypothetical protein
MSMLGEAFRKLRVWAGLADSRESQLTPGHGWLLPAPAAARVQQQESAIRRASHAAERKARA